MTDFFDTTRGKMLKAALYSGTAAVVSSIVVATATHPEAFVFFGIALGPILNVLAVGLKNLMDEGTPN